jgi:hypothetical protein
MLQCAVTAGVAGVLTLLTATGSLDRVRTGADAVDQVTQYCAPEGNSDAPDAPRVYCRDERG